MCVCPFKQRNGAHSGFCTSHSPASTVRHVGVKLVGPLKFSQQYFGVRPHTFIASASTSGRDDDPLYPTSLLRGSHFQSWDRRHEARWTLGRLICKSDSRSLQPFVQTHSRHISLTVPVATFTDTMDPRIQRPTRIPLVADSRRISQFPSLS